MTGNYGLRRAINELKSIIACKWSDGMLPQIRFVPGAGGYRPDADDWGVTEAISGPTRYRTSGITQPPIVGYCAYRVYERASVEDRARYGADFLAVCQALNDYHDWLLRERDPHNEGLVLCLHPWETGTDNSPAFDTLIELTRAFIEESGLNGETIGRADTLHVNPSHRPTERDYYAYFGLIALFKKHAYRQGGIVAESPFLLQDVLFNTLFAASLMSTSLLQLSLASHDGFSLEVASDMERRAFRSKRRAEKTVEAIRRKLWHDADGLFYSYDLRGERLLATPTVSSLTPLLSGVATGEQARRLIAHLENPNSFATPYPVPSTPAVSIAFSPTRYWSGPSWPVTNWLLIEGLRDHNPARAEKLGRATLKMIAEGVSSNAARERAAWVLERNSHAEEFTTPSGAQYAHGWLWDSAIVAMSWPFVIHKPDRAQTFSTTPGFWEYYEPFTGEPLGAQAMSWTASLFLELIGRPIGSGSPF